MSKPTSFRSLQKLKENSLDSQYLPQFINQFSSKKSVFSKTFVTEYHINFCHQFVFLSDPREFTQKLFCCSAVVSFSKSNRNHKVFENNFSINKVKSQEKNYIQNHVTKEFFLFIIYIWIIFHNKTLNVFFLNEFHLWEEEWKVF